MDEPGEPRPRASFLETLRAVGWSFFGVRGRRAHARDVSRLNPVHVIVAGILAAVVFVVVLILVVRAVVH